MNNSNKPELYIVFYSHLDTQWRWDYPHTIKEYIKNTLKDNFALLDKYDNYIFNFSGANRYRFMKEYYPEDYDKLKKYIASGKWFPCGSSFEESDVLTPNIESIIRQILYGNKYFKDEFGIESLEYMLPDCFGFPNTLPSILAHCGIIGFSTQKLSWGSANGIPFNVGKWFGPDDNSVIVSFNPGDYITQVKENLSENDKWFERITKQGNETGIYKEYMYVGTGDWGGAPDEDSIKNVNESIQKEGKIKLIPSKADKFFNDIITNDTSKLPVYKGELLLTNHSAGSLTSQAYVKRWNRKNEFLAYSAEVSSVMNYCITGKEYPQSKINRAWELFLSAQFHDILPGTSIPKAYEYSWNDQITAMNIFADIIKNNIRDISYHLNTNVEGTPIVIYNSLPYEREEIIEVKFKNQDKELQFLSVYDTEQNEIPSQIKKLSSDTFLVIFYAKVPSMGFTVYEIKKSKHNHPFSSNLIVKEFKLENEYLLIELNKNGDINRIFDKYNNKEILNNPIRYIFLHEKPKEFPAWNMDWKDRENEPYDYVHSEPKIRITEFGPVRITIQVERETNGSLFKQEISLGAKSNFLTINNEVEWYTKESSLKTEFPLAISNEKAIYNTGLGIIERGNNDPKKFEVPSHYCFGIYDEKEKYGITIFEDSKYGSDKPNNNTLRLTLLYTPGVTNDFKDQAYQDFGIHNFKFAIYPYKCSKKFADSIEKAEEFNQPMLAFITDKNTGKLGKSFSFLSFEEKGIKISALKKSEYTNDIILRIIENYGENHKDVKLNFLNKIDSFAEVTGQEKQLLITKINSKIIKLNINHNSIKTLSLKTENLHLNNNNHNYRIIDIPFDTKAFTKECEKTDIYFNDIKRFFPEELLKESFIDNGIPFKLILNSKFNALRCNGEEIYLPGENYNYLYLLATSANYDDILNLKINGEDIFLNVPYWNSYIGQWDTRLWDGEIISDKPDYYWGNIDYIGVKPGYIKKEDIAIFTTHTHTSEGKNIPYSYGYIFKYRIPITKETKKIILPRNNNILIFAVTLSTEKAFDIIPGCDLIDNLDRKNYNYSRFQKCKKPKILSDKFLLEPGEKLFISFTTEEEDGEIRFTTDGSEPNHFSQKYESPIEIKDKITLKAATFKNNKSKSETITIPILKGYKIKDIKYLSEFSSKYPGSGNNTLIDTKRASISLLDKGWIGYEVNNLDVIIELFTPKEVNKVTIGFLLNHSSWIFLPEKVEIFFSIDGNSYTKINEHIIMQQKTEEPQIIDIVIDGFSEKAKYIHIIAHNIKKAPDWHHGAGGNAWLFADEIIVE